MIHLAIAVTSRITLRGGRPDRRWLRLCLEANGTSRPGLRRFIEAYRLTIRSGDGFAAEKEPINICVVI